MSHQFFILVDKRDSEKFRQFKIEKFNHPTKQFLDKYDQKFIWSFHKSQITNSIWKKIKKNDIVYFSIPKTNFEITAKISKKLMDKKLGNAIWPDELNSNQITYFMLFEKLQKIIVPFNEIVDHSEKSIVTSIPGIYKIKNTFKLKSRKVKSVMISKKQSIPKSFVMPMKTNGPAQKNISEVTRFVRDSSKVKKLKKLYGNKCQICEYTFEYKKNQFYSEVHHYSPLKENSDDDIDNMIVVCPNHHAELDYKRIAIDLDGKSIINKKGKKITEIHFHKKHKLSEKNIQSQLKGK